MPCVASHQPCVDASRNTLKCSVLSLCSLALRPLHASDKKNLAKNALILFLFFANLTQRNARPCACVNILYSEEESYSCIPSHCALRSRVRSKSFAQTRYFCDATQGRPSLRQYIIIVNPLHVRLYPPRVCRSVNQVATTRDYATTSLFWFYITGGLNHQTAHHLFPGSTCLESI